MRFVEVTATGTESCWGEKIISLIVENISDKLVGGQSARWMSSGPARNITTPSTWHLDSLQKKKKRWPSAGRGNEESIPLFTPRELTSAFYFYFFLSISLCPFLSSSVTVRSPSTCRCSSERRTTVTWGRTPSTRCTGSPGKPSPRPARRLWSPAPKFSKFLSCLRTTWRRGRCRKALCGYLHFLDYQHEGSPVQWKNDPCLWSYWASKRDLTGFPKFKQTGESGTEENRTHGAIKQRSFKYLRL